jgi:hypothetical protein
MRRALVTKRRAMRRPAFFVVLALWPALATQWQVPVPESV